MISPCSDETMTDFVIDDVMAAGAGTVLGGAESGILGDVNGDGVVDVFDVIAGRKALLKGAYTKGGDVDMSGKFELSDLVQIQKFVLASTDKWPTPVTTTTTKSGTTTTSKTTTTAGPTTVTTTASGKPNSDVKVTKAGDANCDGQVDMSDIVLIMQSLANPDKYQISEQGEFNSDLNGDGITNADALAVQKKLLKLD